MWIRINYVWLVVRGKIRFFDNMDQPSVDQPIYPSFYLWILFLERVHRKSNQNTTQKSNISHWKINSLKFLN